MSVSITYSANQPLSTDDTARLLSDVQAFDRQHDWWAEGFWFDDSGATLFGSSKIFLSGFTTDEGDFVETDAFDDLFMATRDIHYIIESLIALSKKYGLEWEIELEGPIGFVGADGPDEGLREVIATLSEESGYSKDSDESDHRSRALSERYNAR